MTWSNYTKMNKLGTVADTNYCIDDGLYIPIYAKKLTSIKCFAVATERTKPFSIYPIKFKIESNDTRDQVIIRDVAVPHCEWVIDLGQSEIKSSDVMIVSCEINLNLELQGGERFMIYANPTIAHVVAPVAFCVFKGE